MDLHHVCIFIMDLSIEVGFDFFCGLLGYVVSSSIHGGNKLLTSILCLVFVRIFCGLLGNGGK